MSIRVTCGGCGKSLTASDKLAGNTVPCPSCKRPLVLPRGGSGSGAASAGASQTSKARLKAEPSLDAPIDFDLMLEASAPEVVEDAHSRRVDGVDWDAIAGKSPAGDSNDSGMRALPDEDVGESVAARLPYNPNDPSFARTHNLQMQKFLRAGALSFFTALQHVPAIFIMVLVYVASIAALAGVAWLCSKAYKADAFGYRVPFWINATLYCVWLSIHVLYAAYVNGYLLDIVVSVKNAEEYTRAPAFQVTRLLWQLILSALFVAVYIVPIVTLPLAPVAFLVLAVHRDLRAFDLIWVARTTFRHPMHALFTIVMAVVFVVLMQVVLVMISQSLVDFAVHFVIKMRGHYSPALTLFILSNLILLALLPLTILAWAATSRVVGLIGRFNTDVLLFLPRTLRPTALSALVALALAVFAANSWWPEIRRWQMERTQRYVDESSARQSPEPPSP